MIAKLFIGEFELTALALYYLTVHCAYENRDLKPENLLLTSDADDADIKIADFGFAKVDQSYNTLATQCGTPAFIAPEILRHEQYGKL